MLTRHAPKGRAAGASAVLNTDGSDGPDERGRKQFPPGCKQYGLGTKRHKMLNAFGDGLRKRLRITCSLPGGKRAVGIPLPSEGWMEAWRTRASAAKIGQEVEVGPKGPGFGQSEAKLASGNARTERSMHGEPCADRRVKPEET